MVGKAYVLGVGMVPFAKPGRGLSYDEMGEDAARLALADAGIEYAAVQQAYVGFVYGDSTSGQKAVYRLGHSSIPVVNVNNACATGSTALFLARQAVASGAVDIALALGFEQMNPGALGVTYSDRKSIMEEHERIVLNNPKDDPSAPIAARMFGGAGLEYQDKYGARTETFAKISEKARTHAARNPFAIFREPLSVEQIMASPPIFGPLTRLQCCPPTCGAAAAIIVSESALKRLGGRAVEIVAQSMRTDPESSFDSGSMISMIGYDMARLAAQDVYEAAGVGPEDVDVVELHDCFTANELLTYEALGLAEAGGAERFIWDGDNTYGGKVVTNPSGGLLSKGHPLGATGLAQCAELVWQVRGDAQDRQVEGARTALQHNLGLGGACVVSLYRPV
ncbi:MAG: lipid-transfer protein [Sphingomonas sp.]